MRQCPPSHAQSGCEVVQAGVRFLVLHYHDTIAECLLSLALAVICLLNIILVVRLAEHGPQIALAGVEENLEHIVGQLGLEPSG